MKSLNLSYNKIKDKKLDKALNDVFFKYQKKFVMLVSKAIQQETKNICLWLSSPVSRITMESKLYYNYCIAIFLKKKIKRKKYLIYLSLSDDLPWAQATVIISYN